jgi:8-oxo-dGTP diphosphatase
VKPKFDSAAPYIAAFIILRNKQNKIAFVLRENTAWMDGKYGLPAGKVEWNESFSLAAIREAKEEAGVTIKPEDVEFAIAGHRHSDDTDWVDVYFVANKWEGKPYNAEPNVHAELAWLDPNNLPDNIVPSQRSALEAMVAGKKYTEFGWS